MSSMGQYQVGQYRDQVISFRLKNTLLAVSILDIREIIPMTPVTPIQKAPDHVAGFINLRGRVMTILDIGVLLNFPPLEPTANTHMILLKHQNVGFWVDGIGDVITPGAGEIRPAPSRGGSGFQEWTHHVIRLPREVVPVLDILSLLSSITETCP